MNNSLEDKKVKLESAVFGGIIALVIGFFAGANWNDFAAKVMPYLGFRTVSSHDWSALDEVYSNLVSYYDGDIDRSLVIEGAKAGLTNALGDIYTNYMTTEEASEYEAALHGDAGSGIGVEMALRDGYVRILRTLPNNPARRVGIKAGDIIYKVNGEECWTESTESISNRIRGETGTEVEVTVIRNGEEKTFKMVRETINNVSAYVEYSGSTAIINVTRFDTDTAVIVRDIVDDEFKDKGVKSVILNLRSNGGGYVSAAKDLLSLWIDGEAVLVQKGKSVGSETMYANKGQATLKGLPTVVLVNSTTASASEIVAGALKDYGLATIIGEKTYGKGVVQTLLNLSGKTMLKVTTARWYTPKGNSINKEGITPDYEVELTYEDANMSRDPQLDAAKKYLKEGKI